MFTVVDKFSCEALDDLSTFIKYLKVWSVGEDITMTTKIFFQVMNCNLISFITLIPIIGKQSVISSERILYSFLSFHVQDRMYIIISCHRGVSPCSKFTQKVQNFGRSPSGADIVSLPHTTTVSLQSYVQKFAAKKLINNPCSYQLETIE